MGAWGSGTFQNDSALDWLGDLRESSGSSLIRKALNRVIDHQGATHSPPSFLRRLLGRSRSADGLTADAASEALAAAEIVTAWLGRPPAELPDGIMEWLETHSSSLQPELVALATKAVNIVRTNSELKDLWEEGDASEWYEAVLDLNRRLQN